MTKCKRKMGSAVLSFVLIITLVLSIGSVTASAAIIDRDVYHRVIDSYVDQFIADWYEHFETVRQCPEQDGTFIFIDSQLLEFDFMERLFNYYNVSYTIEAINAYRTQLGIHFFIHQSENVYWNVTQYAQYGGNANNYLYDFDNSTTLDSLYSYIGDVSMCALGIWQFDSSVYEFLHDLQHEWNGDLPVYVIEREHLVSGSDPLYVYNYGQSGFGPII